MIKSHHKKDAFALVSILSITAAIAFSLGSLSLMGKQRAFTAKRLINRTNALAYAEGGAEFAFSKISKDFSLRNDINAFKTYAGTLNGDEVENPLGKGSYILKITAISNRYCVIRSTGKCGDQAISTELVAEDYNADGSSSTDPSGSAGFEYPILSNGDFSSKGDVTISGSTIHANGNVSLSNSQARNDEITVNTSGEYTKATPVNGSSGVPIVSIPEIDLGPYENEAAINGMVIRVGDPIPNPIVGGILFITGEGETTIRDTISATIIAEGSLNVTGSGSTSPGAGYSLGLVSKDGDITVSGNSSINGLIHTISGDFTARGTPIIEGQLIINGDAELKGTPDAFVFEKTILTPPGTTTPLSENIGVGGWQM